MSTQLLTSLSIWMKSSVNGLIIPLKRSGGLSCLEIGSDTMIACVSSFEIYKNSDALLHMLYNYNVTIIQQ
jgi:hypothetical protein